MTPPQTNPLTARLAEIRERLEKATPGPWFYGGWSGRCYLSHSHNREMCKYDYTKNNQGGTVSSGDESNPIGHIYTTSEYGIMSDEDGELIAHAPSDLTRLLAVVEVLSAALVSISKVDVPSASDKTAWIVMLESVVILAKETLTAAEELMR